MQSKGKKKKKKKTKAAEGVDPEETSAASASVRWWTDGAAGNAHCRKCLKWCSTHSQNICGKASACYVAGYFTGHIAGGVSVVDIGELRRVWPGLLVGRRGVLGLYKEVTSCDKHVQQIGICCNTPSASVKPVRRTCRQTCT